MWCFIDESWHEGKKEHVGVLAAAIGPKSDFDALGKHLFKIRRKYYGEIHARDLRSELKEKELFSNASFKLQQRTPGYSKNLTVAREVLEWVSTSNIRLIGISVYGDSKPALLATDVKFLSAPFKELCHRMLTWVPENQTGQLIFDQRLGAQEDISVAVHNYLAGIRDQHRLIPHPFVGVSNVWPGLQLADIVAYILGKYSINDQRFDFWYKRIQRMQLETKDHQGRRLFGFVRLQWLGGEKYEPRRIRTKK